MIHSIYCRLYIVSFCGFLCTYRKKCSLCIGTFGANIIVMIVINFIVDVTVITKIPSFHHNDNCLECVNWHANFSELRGVIVNREMNCGMGLMVYVFLVSCLL